MKTKFMCLELYTKFDKFNEIIKLHERKVKSVEIIWREF